MGRDDVRFAVAAREDGLRRVRRLTFRLGAAGVVGSAAIALAFSHLPGSAAASSQSGGNPAGSGSQTGGSQPGGSQPGGTQQGGTQQGGGSLQAPAQNVAPAQGPAQGVSGGS
jgi:uncharacterized membrane protein